MKKIKEETWGKYPNQKRLNSEAEVKQAIKKAKTLKDLDEIRLTVANYFSQSSLMKFQIKMEKLKKEKTIEYIENKYPIKENKQ